MSNFLSRWKCSIFRQIFTMCTKSSMMVEYVFLIGTGIYSIYPCPCVFHVCYLFCKFIKFVFCIKLSVGKFRLMYTYGGVDPRYSSRFPVGFFSSVLFLMFSHSCKEVVWFCYLIFIRYAFTILVNLSPWWVFFYPPPSLVFCRQRENGGAQRHRLLNT